MATTPPLRNEASALTTTLPAGANVTARSSGTGGLASRSPTQVAPASRAAYAVYDEERALFTWHRTPYDVAKTQKSIRRAGLPDFLAMRLGVGR